MSDIISKLKGGDLRSIGKVEEVVRDILQDHNLFADVFHAMSDEDTIVRMRASDAIEKVSRLHPQYLQPFKNQLINSISQIDQQEVSWHVAQMLPRLALEQDEISRVISLLVSWLDNSKSNIVKVNSLQAITDIANRYAEYRPFVMAKIEEAMLLGSPAVKSRGRKLIGFLRRETKVNFRKDNSK